MIEDYFILIDDNQPIYQLEPITLNTSDREPTLGIRIIRKLSNGYLKADIQEIGKDNNTVTFRYSEGVSDDKLIDNTQINFCDYSTEEIRTAVRDILIMDKKRTNQ
jgi:hypothetical protein